MGGCVPGLGGSAPRGVWSRGGVCLLGGVCLVGGCLVQGGCLLLGGLLWGGLVWGGSGFRLVCLVWGVSGPGGWGSGPGRVSAPGGFCSGGCGVPGLGGWGPGLGGLLPGGVSQHALRQTPPPRGQNS